MSFRFLFVTVSGEVSGTNDPSQVVTVSDSDTVIAMIDTQAGEYSNDDDSGVPIEQHEEADFDEVGDDPVDDIDD